MLLSYYTFKQLFNAGFLSQNSENQLYNYNFVSLLNFYGCNLTQIILYGFELEQIKKPKGFEINNCGIVEFSTTPNRNDVSNYIGFISEQDLLLCIPKQSKLPFFKEEIQIPYKKIPIKYKDIKFKSSKYLKIGFQTTILNLNIQKSPNWLIKKLQTQDLESSNFLNDIQTYSLHNWGQPIEIYDINKIKKFTNNIESNLNIRYAFENETLVTNLDNDNIKLNPKILVLTYNNKAISIPGLFTPDTIKVDEKTTNCILQSFIFDASIIKSSIQKLGISNELSKIYERGINPNYCGLNFQRILRLIKSKTNTSKIEIEYFNLDFKSQWFNKIEIKYNEINQILGSVRLNKRPLYKKEIILCLQELKLEIINIKHDRCTICIPSNRSLDLKNTADIIEEIARIYNFKNFNSKLPQTSKFGSISFEEEIINKSREFLTHTGFTEFYSYSLVPSMKPSRIALSNPLSYEYSNLRTSLASNIVKHYINNSNKGNQNTSIFEIGRLFNLKLNSEATFVGGLFGAREFSSTWNLTQKNTLSWFEAKEEIIRFLKNLEIKINWQKIQKKLDPMYHSNSTTYIFHKEKEIGFLAKINPLFAEKNKISKDIYIFEINLSYISYLQQKEKKQKRYKPFSTQPSIRKDLSFNVPISMTNFEFSNKLKTIINNIDLNGIVQSIELFDTYIKEENKANIQNLGFSIIFQDKTKTLLNTDIDSFVENIFKEYNKLI